MPLISIKEAAKRLHLDNRTLRRWIDKGTVIARPGLNGRLGIEESEIIRVERELQVVIQQERNDQLETRVSSLEHQLEEMATRLTLLESKPTFNKTPAIYSVVTQEKQSTDKRTYHRKPEHSNQPPDTITIAELASDLGITPRTLREHISNHNLPHVSIEKRVKQDGTIEHDRYFTSEQVAQIKTWHTQHSRK